MSRDKQKNQKKLGKKIRVRKIGSPKEETEKEIQKKLKRRQQQKRSRKKNRK